MNRRNIINYSTFNNILATNLDIINHGPSLNIQSPNDIIPTFSIDTISHEMNLNGTFNVVGNATFQTINVSAFTDPMQKLADGNPADTSDLGLYGEYNNGLATYTGIVRDASDTLQRWTFFNNITTLPNLTIPGIDSTKLDSVRMNKIYVNDGSVSSPSYNFHNDIDNDTGFFLSAENAIGITCGNLKVVDISKVSGSDTRFTMDSTTTLGLLKLNTIDDSTSANVAVTKGHIYITSESAKDKWFQFYSTTGAATPSYTGTVYTSTSENYFITNTGGLLEFVYNSSVVSASSSPDYRHASTASLLRFHSNTKISALVPFLLTSNNNISSLDLRFYGAESTGLYYSGTNSIGLVCNAVNIINITPSIITFTNPTRNIDGSLSTPSTSFTNSTNSGLWRDSGLGKVNVSIAVSGLNAAKFLVNTTIPQLTMPINGTNAIPSYAFTDLDTGFYAPTNEAASNQIGVTLGSVESWRFRARSGTGSGNTQCYNIFEVTPDAIVSTMVVDSNSTTITNYVKGNNASFQSYNLIDTSILMSYNFKVSGDLGKDSSSNSFDATLAGAPVYEIYVVDSNGVVKKNVLDLTGNPASNSYLNLTPYLSNFQSLTSAAISFWYKAASNTTNMVIFNACNTGAAKSIAIEILASTDTYANALQVTIQSDSLTTLQYHTNGISIADNLWHHIIIQIGTTGAKNIYVDGTLLTVVGGGIVYTSNGTNVANPEESTNSFADLTLAYVTIGARYSGTVPSLLYKGYIKDFYITGRLLATLEVVSLSVESSFDTYSIDAAVINVGQVTHLNPSYAALGTAAEPSITFAADPDTGIYNSAANVIGFSTTGSERLTISNTVLQYNTSDFEVDSTNKWLKVNMGGTPISASGPRIVFDWTSSGNMRHYISTNHNGSSVTGNYFDFYLQDGNGQTSGLGTNNVFRIGQTASGPNTALISMFGISRIYNGSVSAPAYSFINSTGLGLYRISDNDLGITANGTLRLEVNTVVTIGNAAGDNTTRLYVPLGEVSLPSLSFIDDTNTGIYSSTTDNMDITCGGTLVSNFSTSGQVAQLPLIVDYDSTSTFIVRKNGAPAGGETFTVDTTNQRVGIGFTSLYIGRHDSYNNSTQRMKIGASSDISLLGILFLNENTTSTNAAISSMNFGRTATARNAIDMSFYYVSSGNTSNKLQFGFNAVSSDQFNIKADGSTNVTGTFSVSGGSTLTGQVQSGFGSASMPAYSFSTRLTDGIYSAGANQIGFATNGTIRCLISDSYQEIYNPLRLPSGTTTLPSLTFTSDTSQDTGLYYISNNRFGISNGDQNTWIFDKRGTLPHECLNEIYFKPDGTNLRLYVQDAKLRASSNQTILNKLPILHYKFSSAPSTNLTTQDGSINKYSILATTVSYVTSTISLTDTNGVGLLQYQAAQIVTAANDRIETSSIVSELLYLSDFNIRIKFKIQAAGNDGVIFDIYGNRDGSTTTNYIRLETFTGRQVQLSIHNGTSLTLSATLAALSSDTWYDLVVSFTSAGNSITINNIVQSLTYNTGSSAITITPAGFANSSNLTVIVGGVTNSLQSYIAEFVIAPVSTTETVNAIYRTQAHEIYTNKLQIATTTQGLVDEGYLLRSDKANNAIWDNSLQIAAGYIQTNNSKVFRLPNATSALPSYSFVNDSASGTYLIGAGNVGISASATKIIDINTTRVNFVKKIFVEYQAGASQIELQNSDVGTNFGGRLFVDSGKAIHLASAISGNQLYLEYNGSNSGVLLRADAAAVNSTQSLMIKGSDGTNYRTALNFATFTVSAGVSTGGQLTIQSPNNATQPSYSFLGDTTSGIYSIASNQIGISTGGTNRIDISNTQTQINNIIQLNSGFRRTVSVVTTQTLTLDLTYNIVLMTYSATSNAITITLPAVSISTRGLEYTIINRSTSGSALVINTNSNADFIDNSSTITISLANPYDRVTLVSDGISNWYTM